MLPDDQRHVPVMLKCGGRATYAEGGLASAADAVRGAGRNGDDYVVHVNKREFEEMMQRWGEPTINPDTGLPEFFLGDLWDDAKNTWNDVKDWVVPVGAAAAGAFLPGIGSAIGSVLPGVAGFLGQAGTQALGAGLLGAGAGYLANGGQGALLGGLGGVAGAYGADWWNNGADSAVGGLLTNLSSGVGMSGLGGKVGGSAAAEATGMGSSAIYPALAMAGLNMAGSLFGGSGEADGPPAGWDDAPGPSWEELPKWESKRRRKQYSVLPDYTQEGEREYFEENRLAEGGRPTKRQDRHPANGGYAYDPGVSTDVMMNEMGISPLGWIGYLLGLQQEEPEVAGGKVDLEVYARGGKAKHKPHRDGRVDDIKALLSPNEYVIDAETVALLGDGSPDAGAARLDAFRENIRKHKGAALAYGKISPDAMPPEQYLG